MGKFKDDLARLGFASYDAYLDSEHWEDFKSRYQASTRPMKCSICGNGKIQLHHHTYQRLGSERIDDVTPLCGVHHQEVHAILKAKKWFVESTPQALNVIKSRRPQPKLFPVKSIPKKHIKEPKLVKLSAKRKRQNKHLLAMERTRVMIDEFISLRKAGSLSCHVPQNYDPQCNDGKLSRYVKILRRAKPGYKEQKALRKLEIERRRNESTRQRIEREQLVIRREIDKWEDPVKAMRCIAAGLRPKYRKR